MKKTILFGLLILSIVIISGCTHQTETMDDGTKVTMSENILTESIEFESEDVTGSVTKNKLTKTAEIEMTMYLNDTAEEESTFGDQSMIPWMLNFTCNIFAVAFFNADEWEDANMTSDTINKLEGYEITRFEFETLDKENGQKISDCVATSEDDVRFTMHRDY